MVGTYNTILLDKKIEADTGGECQVMTEAEIGMMQL